MLRKRGKGRATALDDENPTKKKSRREERASRKNKPVDNISD